MTVVPALQVAVSDRDATPNGAIVERGANGLEVVGEAGVVRLKAVGTVEAELARIEVRIDFRLIGAGHLEFACPS
jgi:hypothetical protein